MADDFSSEILDQLFPSNDSGLRYSEPLRRGDSYNFRYVDWKVMGKGQLWVTRALEFIYNIGDEEAFRLINEGPYEAIVFESIAIDDQLEFDFLLDHFRERLSELSYVEKLAIKETVEIADGKLENVRVQLKPSFVNNVPVRCGAIQLISTKVNELATSLVIRVTKYPSEENEKGLRALLEALDD